MSKVEVFHTPVKEMRQSGRFMQRSGTMTTLNKELKDKMDMASNNKNRGFESYINKPLKATSGAVEMEKFPGGSERQSSADADKLPKLNRYNVRALD